MGLKAILLYSFVQNEKLKLVLVPKSAIDEDFEEVLKAFKALALLSPSKAFQTAFTATIWDAPIDYVVEPSKVYYFSKVKGLKTFNEACQFSCSKNDITVEFGLLNLIYSLFL